MQDERLGRTVLKNTILNSSGTIIGSVGGLILSIILARMLGPELLGIYYLALSIGLLLLNFTDLGINRTLVRYISDAIGKNDEELARSYFKYLFRIKCILAITFSALLALFAKPLSIFIFDKPLLFLPLVAIGLFICLRSFYGFLNGSFQALQRFKYQTIGICVYEGLRLILAPLFVLTLSVSFHVFGAVIGLSISAAFASLVLFCFLLKDHPYLLRGATVHFERRRILRFLSFLTVGSISVTIYTYIDSIMLGILLPLAEYVGFYRTACIIVFGIAELMTMTAVLFPVFTQIEGDELKNAFKMVFKYSSILSFPCAFGLPFIAEPLITTLYGSEYILATGPMCILSLLIIASVTNFFGVLFNAKEKPEYPTVIIIVSCILNIVLNYFFILRLGMIGAAIATVISRYFNFISLGILSKRILSISPDLKSIYKPFLASLAMIFLYFIPTPSILMMIIELSMAGAIYLTVLFLIGGVGREDWRYLKTIIMGR
jgi:O-antigen/teichoic acid export membrane protein